jgi:hypothetical protein
MESVLIAAGCFLEVQEMIKFYSIPECGICKVMKKKLELKNISFEEIQDGKLAAEKFNTDHFPIVELEDGKVLNSPLEIKKWIEEQ